jgi:hypothetical protein
MAKAIAPHAAITSRRANPRVNTMRSPLTATRRPDARSLSPTSSIRGNPRHGFGRFSPTQSLGLPVERRASFRTPYGLRQTRSATTVYRPRPTPCRSPTRGEIKEDEAVGQFSHVDHRQEAHGEMRHEIGPRHEARQNECGPGGLRGRARNSLGVSSLDIKVDSAPAFVRAHFSARPGLAAKRAAALPASTQIMHR